MTKAKLWPVADRTSQWFAEKYPGSTFKALEKICVHTTEGSGWPPYSGGSEAPNFTGFPNVATRQMMWRQHFPIDMSSRALRHPAGTQATNTDSIVQIELVGTCVSTGPGMFWPKAPEWALQGVAEFFKFIHDEWGVPLNSTVQWRPYRNDDDAQRLSPLAFNAYRGILGHQHVPNNDHRDPGNLDVATIIRLAAGKGTNVPLTSTEVDAIANRVRDIIWSSGWGGTRGPDGKVERADFRLYMASHPEYAAGPIADAVAKELGPVIAQLQKDFDEARAALSAGLEKIAALLEAAPKTPSA